MSNLIIDTTFYKIAAYKNWQEGDKFFNQFNLFSLIQQNRYIDVIDLGKELLNHLKQIDEKAYRNIHKGTPFYWMGMASFLMHDFTTATFFFDAAVSEDINNKSEKELKESPSILFALLDDSKAEQAARYLVSATKQRIEEYINIYNDPSLNNGNLNLDFIRNSLLKKSILCMNHPWRNLSTSLISFFLEWDYRQILFNLRNQDGSCESFFIHLFKGCLLFESLLKENPKNSKGIKGDTLNKLLPKYQEVLGLKKENLKISCSLPMILKEIKTMHYSLPKFIEITGKVRNTLGHSLVWSSSISSDEYQDLFMYIALSCLHLIRKLY